MAFIALVLLSFGSCLVAMIIAPFVGSAHIDFRMALTDSSSLDGDVLCRVRLPRTCFAAMGGGALAIAGVVFQAVPRNPLASPFTLSISGGSSLGAVLGIRLGWDISVLGVSFLPFASFAGALLVILLVYALFQSPRYFSPLTPPLSWVLINFMCTALALLLHYSQISPSPS